jgi:hypothetical protein
MRPGRIASEHESASSPLSLTLYYVAHGLCDILYHFINRCDGSLAFAMTGTSKATTTATQKNQQKGYCWSM